MRVTCKREVNFGGNRCGSCGSLKERFMRCGQTYTVASPKRPLRRAGIPQDGSKGRIEEKHPPAPGAPAASGMAGVSGDWKARFYALASSFGATV